MLKIDYNKCCFKDGKCTSDCGCDQSECPKCVNICPVDALKKGDKVTIDTEACIECGACTAVCPKGALILE